MSQDSHRSFWTLAIGLSLLVIGFLMLIDNLDLVEIHSVWRFWPFIFIAVGIGKLFNQHDTESRRKGIFWLMLGTWFLVSEFHLFGLSYHSSWPLLLIGWGIAVVLRSFNIPRDRNASIVSEAHHA